MAIALPKLIKRVFNISGNTELAAIIEQELSEPMFAKPGFGDAYARAFLGNASPEFFASNGEESGSSVGVTILSDINTAVIDISGAMLAKEMVVPCAKSPTSYEAIRFEMSKLLANDAIENIVARLDTGGGVVSQLVDLSDWIYSQRGKGTHLYAMVDDAAYSAGYGIASAFDEIWITRSGGVGSVGIVARFEDKSKKNEMEGKTVEYLYYGDKKVFGNSDEPLSDEAREEMMTRIKMHYDMFTTATARNLNISLKRVVDTQAGVFTGQEAINAGFAHKLGTFNDLLTHIEDKEMSNRTQAQIDADRNALSASLEKQQGEVTATQAAIEALDAEVASDASPEASTAPVTDPAPATPATPEASTAPVADPAPATPVASAPEVDQDKLDAEAREAGIRAVVSAAGKDELTATNYIKSGLPLADVRKDLVTLSANDNQDDIQNHLGSTQKKDQASQGWDSALGTK